MQEKVRTTINTTTSTTFMKEMKDGQNVKDIYYVLAYVEEVDKHLECISFKNKNDLDYFLYIVKFDVDSAYELFNISREVYDLNKIYTRHIGYVNTIVVDEILS